MILKLALVDSTQAFLRRHRELWPCAVLADTQTEGRGRGENRWESAPGAGLWLSVALPKPSTAPGLLLQRAMLAVIEALEPCGLELGLKWPNDLVARRDGQLVKLGGIIGEISGDFALLGLGVNLLAAPEIPGRAIRPASLRESGAGWIPDPMELSHELLRLWADLDTHREPAFWWPAQGDQLRWEEGQGICEGWMVDGQLAVRTAEGLKQLYVGDVSGLA